MDINSQILRQISDYELRNARKLVEADETDMNQGLNLDEIKQFIQANISNIEMPRNDLLINCILEVQQLKACARRKVNDAKSVSIVRVFLKELKKPLEVILECLIPEVGLRKLSDEKEIGLDVFLVPEAKLGTALMSKEIGLLIDFQIGGTSNKLTITREGQRYTFRFQQLDHVPWVESNFGQSVSGKFFLVFKGYALVGDQLYPISVESSSFMIKTHTYQKLEAWIKILLESAFGMIAPKQQYPNEGESYTGRTRLPMSIPIKDVVQIYSRQFKKNTKGLDVEGRGFNDLEKGFVAHQMQRLTLTHPSVTHPQNLLNLGALFELSEINGFSFNKWICDILKLTVKQSFLKKCWSKSWIQLISDESAKDLLNNGSASVGTFTMRFTTTELASVVLQSVHKNSVVKKFTKVYVDDQTFIKRLRDRKKLLILHNGVPKDTILPPVAETATAIDRHGYTHEEDISDDDFESAFKDLLATLMPDTDDAMNNTM